MKNYLEEYEQAREQAYQEMKANNPELLTEIKKQVTEKYKEEHQSWFSRLFT